MSWNLENWLKHSLELNLESDVWTIFSEAQLWFTGISLFWFATITFFWHFWFCCFSLHAWIKRAKINFECSKCNKYELNFGLILHIYHIIKCEGFFKSSFHVKSTLCPIWTKLKKKKNKTFKNLLIPKLNLYTLVQKISNPISIPEFCVWFLPIYCHTNWENKNDQNRWMAFLM